MAAEPAPRLSLVEAVDHATGEVVDATVEALALENQHLRDELAELLRKFKGQSRELAAMRRDREAEAEADPLWPLAVRLFVYHSKVCNHPRAEWTAERFQMVRRLAKRRSQQEWLLDCLRAIAGVRADAWRMANGLSMWEDIFESQKKFERCLAKCPAGWVPPAGVLALV